MPVTDWTSITELTSSPSKISTGLSSGELIWRVDEQFLSSVTVMVWKPSHKPEIKTVVKTVSILLLAMVNDPRILPWLSNQL